jgi:hypothetical protein
MALALLAAGASLVLLLVCVAAARWIAARNLEGVLEELEEPAGHALPHGHRPPPGLGPIPASERTLAAEAERGIRDLQAFLLDAA